ncbi:hypothetical protein CTI12_AA563650 [Artemisia annua]|uniref:TIR domain-containing protein n=1 Tax=Artemisia annua TaxID=35608 RepID=A0A2U1KTZ2_ARTAN|nr:hypothetical protein CTI12_AA563650 [Artemisia annua]
MVIIKDVTEASSSTNTHKYDIFISFRGIDTRNTFTAHLHQALKEANYETFYDDEEIEFGKPLKEKLVNGIKASKSSVVVLSENYASSTWCLEELVLILEQLANSDHYVFPIFYHVKPSDIGKQLNSFADAMEKHKQRMEDETSAERKSEWVQNMVKWKKALEQFIMVIIKDVAEASSSTNTHKYDIFISFRGIDTRNTFTAHLHQALKEANYETFYDDEEIEFGKPLKEKLVNGIKASKSSVVVLSENYASSTWCLEELVLILEQLASSDHYVFPIFYHVKPSNIGKQLNSFADAMEKHKQRMEAETSAERKSEWAQNMVKWKKALQHVSKIKGKEPKGQVTTFLI